MVYVLQDLVGTVFGKIGVGLCLLYFQGKGLTVKEDRLLDCGVTG